MKTLLFLALLFIFNFLQEPNNCIIVPGKGVNSIIIGQSTLKDIEKEFGEKKVEKKWHKAVETEIMGRFEYFVHYDKIGTFSTYTRNRNKTIIMKISIDTTSKCRTKKGLGIGNTYRETIRELGEANQISFVQDKKKYIKMELLYDNMNIWFDGNDSTNNKIIEIEIYK